MHKDRFKQMYRVSRGLLTCHRRLLDLDHGQAPAPRLPVMKECCLRPAIRLHGPTAAQVPPRRNLHPHSHQYHLRATTSFERMQIRQLVGT